MLADEILRPGDEWKPRLNVALMKRGQTYESIEYLQETMGRLEPYIDRFPELCIASQKFGAACGDLLNFASMFDHVPDGAFAIHMGRGSLAGVARGRGDLLESASLLLEETH